MTGCNHGKNIGDYYNKFPDFLLETEVDTVSRFELLSVDNQFDDGTENQKYYYLKFPCGCVSGYFWFGFQFFDVPIHNLQLKYPK